MSESSNQQPINNKVVEVMVESIFRKNGVTADKVKKNISEDQKKMLKEMVMELQNQVEEFQQNQTKEEK